MPLPPFSPLSQDMTASAGTPSWSDTGLGPARSYFVQVDGRLHDSKAFAGAPHCYSVPKEGPLAAKEFSGGEPTVAWHLQALGFTVVNQSNSLVGWL